MLFRPEPILCVNGIIYLIASYDFFCEQRVVLYNKPRTIPMSSAYDFECS